MDYTYEKNTYYDSYESRSNDGLRFQTFIIPNPQKGDYHHWQVFLSLLNRFFLPSVRSAQCPQKDQRFLIIEIWYYVYDHHTVIMLWG